MATVTSSKRQQTHTSNTYESNSTITASDHYAINTSSSYQKLSVYGNGGTYGIGMVSGITYGALSDWAMTFRFNSENDRGFWWGDTSHSTAQGAMSLTTNGYLTVANRVKVGGGETDTSGPSYPLHVVGKIYSSTEGQFGNAIAKNNSGVATFGSNSTATTIKINLDASASRNDLVIEGSTGDVGIGTDDPFSALDVNTGTITLRESVYTYHQFTSNSDGLNIINNADRANVTRNIIFKSSVTGSAITERMRITGAGNVGIGTTSPAVKLAVVGEVSGTSHAIFDGRIQSNNQLRVSNDYSANYFFKTDNTTMLGYLLMRADNNSFLSFPAAQDFRILHGNTSRIAVKTDGNVGIGTVSPNTKLNIKGDQSANGQLYIEPTNDGEYAGLVIKTTRGADRAYAIFAGGTGTDDLNFRFRDASAGADRMVIDSSGKVGIGTVSPSTALHVAGKVTVDTLDTDTNLTNFVVVDSNGELHKRTGGASGSSGTSGSSGDNGNSGSSGSSGNNGTSGSSGNNGTSGSSGNNGTSGSSGNNGTSGSSGNNGTSGSSGNNGTSGSSGNNGNSGSSGSSGNNGTSGSSGNNGTSGSSGNSGSSGSSGNTGTDGSSGNTIAHITTNASDVTIGASNNAALGVYGYVAIVGNKTSGNYALLNGGKSCLSGDVCACSNIVAASNITGTVLCGTSCVCTVGVHCTSDERLKKDITNYRPIGGLACSVMSLRAVEYKWKDSAKSQKCNIGFIAQEVEKVIPSAVSCSPEISDGLKDKRAIDHGPILATLLELSKEHQIKIEKLEKEVKNLKKLV